MPHYNAARLWSRRGKGVRDGARAACYRFGTAAGVQEERVSAPALFTKCRLRSCPPDGGSGVADSRSHACCHSFRTRVYMPSAERTCYAQARRMRHRTTRPRLACPPHIRPPLFCCSKRWCATLRVIPRRHGGHPARQLFACLKQTMLFDNAAHTTPLIGENAAPVPLSRHYADMPFTAHYAAPLFSLCKRRCRLA